MSKAVEGAVLIGVAAAGLAAMTFATGGLGAIANTMLFAHIVEAIAVSGLAMESGAIASALTSNRGAGITTRQPASFRQIIYGEQRVGGVTVYESTTGGAHDQYNYVIALAGRACASIVNLYLDGRVVHWNGSNTGGNNTRPDGTNFGGPASGGTFVGPGGQHYNFDNLVYCEAYYGDQTDAANTTPGGGFSTGLQANDPAWCPSGGKVPYLAGCTYVYLKVEYDAAMFPNPPEIKFTVRGKNNIYDPRSGTSGYSTNWALIVADVLTDTQFGLGDVGAVNTDQLIAAANVCDEMVALANGETEARYSCHFHYDTSTDPGNVLSIMMNAAVGRLSRIGGQWYIWPAYWQGPSFTFDGNALTGKPSWTPNRSLRELFNRVNGTYVAANYPYNTAGNLYDSNGWFDGTLSNTFPFAFQPTNYPQYACDARHGYASDEYLTDDGKPLPHEMMQQCCLSVAQAQRCAKITLLKNRQQGSGTFPMHLWAWEMQPTDVMQFTFAAMGWTEKTLEIVSTNLRVEPGESDGEQPSPPRIGITMGVAETASTVYEWNADVDELTVYDVPAGTGMAPYTPIAPTAMSLTSGASTALIGADGVIYPRIEVQWTVPQDGLVTLVQIMFQPVTAPEGPWLDVGLVDVGSTLAFISGVIAGQQYNVRIRSVRGSTGAVSPWEEIDGYTVSVTLSTITQFALAPGSLVGEAYSDGTAGIIVSPFTAVVGRLSVSCLPAGPYTITGLNQSQLYFVYYIDPTFAGGAITPIATQNQADYLDKVGYFFIDSIVTPAYSAGAGMSGTRFYPSSYSDTGSRTTTTPTAAYDGNLSTAAVVSGTWSCTSTGATRAFTTGNFTLAGFPPDGVPAATLKVVASVVDSVDGTIPWQITATLGGTTSTLVSSGDAYASTTFTLAIPAGSNLGSLSVNAQVMGNDGGLAGGEGPVNYSVKISIAECYVQLN